MMKNKKIKFPLLILCGLALIVYVINFFNRAVNELSDNPVRLEKVAPTDYLNLFNPQSQKYLVLQSAASFKLRSTIVELVYNNEYDIEVSKITIRPDFHIINDIAETYDKSKGIPSKTKASYGGNDFKINYNGISKDNVSNIYLTLYGDSTHTYHKNDSIAYYYSNLNNGYVQYSPEGVYEVSIEAKKKFYFFDQKKPIIAMFLKKNNFLYFITLHSHNGYTALSPDILYKLVQF